MINWLILILILFSISAIYLKIAVKFNIIDKPNQRSSHSIPVVRGGGIIFPIGWVLYSLWNGFAHPWLTCGLIILSLISFWDDMRPLSAAQRSVFHAIACALLFNELSFWTSLPIWGVFLVFIAVIGILNAFNFMDGINGITGMYALAVLCPLLPFVPGIQSAGLPDPLSSLIFVIIMSVLIFGFYNFRKKARCFAGDVGSISIGYILIFILLSLMTDKENSIGLYHPDKANGFNLQYILLFSVYGVDSVLTILHRIRLGENIIEAHRRHLYQYLANEKGIPHLAISFGYALVQSAINIYLLNSASFNWIHGLLILFGLTCIYIWIKSPQLFRQTQSI